MRKLFLLTGTLALIFTGLVSMQDKSLAETRMIVITYPDSTIHTRILIAKSSIQPDPDKIYYWYTPDCINKNQGGFSGYLLHGEYSVFDAQQKLLAKGAFSEGLKTGLWRKWYDNGNIAEIATWKKGLLNGPTQRYDQMGKLLCELNFKQGVEHVKHFQWFKKGQKSDGHKKDALDIILNDTISIMDGK